MIKGALEKLDLPDFPHKENLEDTRREMLRILLENEYGVMPERKKRLFKKSNNFLNSLFLLFISRQRNCPLLFQILH